MEQSMFFGSFVPSGKKVTSSSRPEIIVTSTKDKFNLNDNAMRLLGLQVGDRVVMIDRHGMPGCESQEDRFYITKGFTHKGIDVGAKIGKNRTFSYSGIYSAIQADDLDIRECTAADLVRRGKGIINEESDNFIATQKVRMEVIEFGEFAPEEGVDPVMIYKLQDFEFVDHDPKGIDEDVDE